MFSLARKSVFLERPQVAFDAFEPLLEVRLHIEYRPVVIVRSNFAGEQLKDFGRFKRTQVQFEAILHEALDLVIGLTLLFRSEGQDRRLLLDRHYQRPSHAAKFCSNCRPWVWLFSGWNCTAKREPSASAAAKSTP